MTTTTIAPRFATSAEMDTAGYTRGYRISYRGFDILPLDVSEGRSYGYSYAIGLRAGPVLGWDAPNTRDHEPHYELTSRRFGYAASVWLIDELNSARQRGAFSMRFSRDTWERGVAEAQAAIDEWLAHSPVARAAIEADAQELAAIAARQAAKLAQRRRARERASIGTPRGPGQSTGEMR